MAAHRRRWWCGLPLLLLLLELAAWSHLVSAVAVHRNGDVPEQKLLSQLGMDKTTATVVSNDNTLLSGKSTVALAAPPPAQPANSEQTTTDRVDHVTPVHERIHDMNHELLKLQASAMKQQRQDTNEYILQHNQDLAANTAAKVQIVRDTALKHGAHDTALHKQELALEGRHAQHTDEIAQKMHDLGVAKAERLRQFELSSLDLEKQRLAMEKQQLLHWNRNQLEHLGHVADVENSWKKVNERKLQNTADVAKQAQDIEASRNKLYQEHIRRWKVIKNGLNDVIRQQVDDLRSNPPAYIASDDASKGQASALTGSGDSGILNGAPAGAAAGGGVSFASGAFASGGVPLYNAGLAGPAMPVGGGYGYARGGGFGGGGLVLSMVPTTSPPPCSRFRSVARLLRGSELPSTAPSYC